MMMMVLVSKQYKVTT